MEGFIFGITLFVFIVSLCLAILATYEYFGLVMAVLPLFVLYITLLIYYRTAKAKVAAKAQHEENRIIAEVITKDDRPI